MKREEFDKLIKKVVRVSRDKVKSVVYLKEV